MFLKLSEDTIINPEHVKIVLKDGCRGIKYMLIDGIEIITDVGSEAIRNDVFDDLCEFLNNKQ